MKQRAESMLGAVGEDNRCDVCNQGTMQPVVATLPVSLPEIQVLVPGVLAYRCDHCSELEWDGPEADRARKVARLLLDRKVA